MLNPQAGAHSSPGPNMSAFEDPSLDEQFRDLDEILSPLFSSQGIVVEFTIILFHLIALRNTEQSQNYFLSLNIFTRS